MKTSVRTGRPAAGGCEAPAALSGAGGDPRAPCGRSGAAGAGTRRVPTARRRAPGIARERGDGGLRRDRRREERRGGAILSPLRVPALSERAAEAVPVAGGVHQRRTLAAVM
jgi:hypothetical protein